MADRDYVTDKDRVVDRDRVADLDRDRKTTDPDANPDPITGAPGSHPVGTGVGAAAGGAAAAWAGAAIGAAVSGPAAPIGGVIGAVVGAVAGGLAGKGVAESIDPTAEDAYWRDTYKTRPYVESGRDYDYYQPAYQYGWESRGRYTGKKFHEVESDLGRDWDKSRSSSGMTWETAKHPVRDAFERPDVVVVDNRSSFDDPYWRQNYSSRPYFESGMTYDDYEPAYRYASESRARYSGRNFDDVESDLGRGWEQAKGKSRLGWEKAKLAARDAWHRVERAIPGDADRDGR